MPLYDYGPASGKCKRCNGCFEVVQRVADPKLKTCPACHKQVVRLVTGAAVHTKFSMSPSKLSDLGMTKYQKTSDGSYQRTVGGKGPKMIREPKD